MKLEDISQAYVHCVELEEKAIEASLEIQEDISNLRAIGSDFSPSSDTPTRSDHRALWPAVHSGKPQAISKLTARLKRDEIYSDPCFYFVDETDEDPAAKTGGGIPFYVYAVREQHGNGCPGDPNTSPAIDRFRVGRSSGKIEWLDIVSDQWKPYSAFLNQHRK